MERVADPRGRADQLFDLGALLRREGRQHDACTAQRAPGFGVVTE
jgi:hypothetical protein